MSQKSTRDDRSFGRALQSFVCCRIVPHIHPAIDRNTIYGINSLEKRLYCAILPEDMPTIRRPRLLKTEVLRKIKSSNLLSLLSPHEKYFAVRGINLAQLGSPRFDYAKLATVLACSTEFTPPLLVENLELLDLISGSQCALNFETEYNETVQRLREEDDTAADIAVKILLHAPEIALRESNRQAMTARDTRVSFRVKPGMPYLGATPERIDAFKAIVAPWFAANSRSGACLVHHAADHDGDSFVVRHGDLLKRLGVLDEDGKHNLCVVRPERTDVAHFNHTTGEWQVSGLGVKIHELYRQAYGSAFHGSPEALVYSSRYSLEPLRDGPESLRCDLSATIQHAELKSLKIELPGGQSMALQRPPVFEALHDTNPRLLASCRLVEAAISLKLANRKTRILVRICPDRDTISGNTSDPAIDEWLRDRRFANDDISLLASA